RIVTISLAPPPPHPPLFPYTTLFRSRQDLDQPRPCRALHDRPRPHIAGRDRPPCRAEPDPGRSQIARHHHPADPQPCRRRGFQRSEEHTSELQSPDHLVCRLLLEKKT